jgi:hypothetical protein
MCADLVRGAATRSSSLPCPSSLRRTMAHRSVRGRLGSSHRRRRIAARRSHGAARILAAGRVSPPGAQRAAQRAAEPAVELRSVAPAGSSDGTDTAEPYGSRGPTYEPSDSCQCRAGPRCPGFWVRCGSRTAASLRSYAVSGRIPPLPARFGDPDRNPAAVRGRGQHARRAIDDSGTAGPCTRSGRVRWSTASSRCRADAAQQGLEHATIALPDGSGRLRNGAYAVQWWVFAAFTVVMAVRMARESRVGLVREST